jgi:hypothetical protein
MVQSADNGSEKMAGHYHVAKSGKAWRVTRVDAPCRIGTVDSRKEALLIARMLAGWRGSVTVERSGKAARRSAALD